MNILNLLENKHKRVLFTNINTQKSFHLPSKRNKVDESLYIIRLAKLANFINNVQIYIPNGILWYTGIFCIVRN